MKDSNAPTPSLDESYIANLEDIAAVEISGADAQEFLSNQLSSDVKALIPNELQHSAWCDPKGRVLFYLLLAKTEDAILCFVTKDLAEQFCKRLTMFVLRSAVSIEPLETSTVLAINNATEQSQNSYYFPNKQSSSAIRCLSLVADADVQNAINTAGVREDKNQWRYDDIVLGRPYLPSAASGAFLPQNLNLDALEGISFSKGCYPGQEIVARLKYRGKVKQRLALLHSASNLKTDQPVPPMTSIFAVGSEDKKIGTTVNSQKIGDHLTVAGILEIDFLQNKSDVRIDGFEEIFSVSPPPYDIEY